MLSKEQFCTDSRPEVMKSYDFFFPLLNVNEAWFSSQRRIGLQRVVKHIYPVTAVNTKLSDLNEFYSVLSRS